MAPEIWRSVLLETPPQRRDRSGEVQGHQNKSVKSWGRVNNANYIERLRLVKLVLDDLMSSSTTWLVDESDTWGEKDYADLTRISLVYAAQSLGEQPQ